MAEKTKEEKARYQREYYLNNKNKINEYQRLYYHSRKEKCLVILQIRAPKSLRNKIRQRAKDIKESMSSLIVALLSEYI